MNAPVTDAELSQMWGIEKTYKVHDSIMETITKAMPRVGHANLFVPHVSYRTGVPVIAPYKLIDVVKDYSTDPKPLAALMDVLDNSNCQLVAEFRKVLAQAYSDSAADEVEEFLL